jgi:hypothetical protein
MERLPRFAVWALAAIGVAAVLALAFFLSSSDSPRTLDEAETMRVLEQLPYEIEFRPVATPPGASGAVAGRAVGPGGAVVRFGVSLGRGGEPVNLGPHSDTDAAGGETFRVSDDATLLVDGKLRIARRLRTPTQWREAARIVVDVEEQLCRATTGKSCSI